MCVFYSSLTAATGCARLGESPEDAMQDGMAMERLWDRMLMLSAAGPTTRPPRNITLREVRHCTWCLRCEAGWHSFVP
jgi:hypothetical protein